MLKGKVVEERLEDGELGLQGGEVRTAEGGAVGGVGGGEGRAVLEGGQTYASAGGHGELRCSLSQWMHHEACRVVASVPQPCLARHQVPSV